MSLYNSHFHYAASQHSALMLDAAYCSSCNVVCVLACVSVERIEKEY